MDHHSHMLNLPERQQGLLHNALKHLAQAGLTKDKLRLGGGTTLAARWKHRESFDIDIFTSAKIYASAAAELVKAASLWQRLPEFSEVRLFPTVIHCNLADGMEFSCGGSDDITSGAESLDVEASTGMGTQSSAEIIVRKLRARMVNTQAYLIRDVYDVVCCAIHDFDALNHALSFLQEHEISAILFDLNQPESRLNADAPLVGVAYNGLDDPKTLERHFVDLLSDPEGWSFQPERTSDADPPTP